MSISFKVFSSRRLVKKLLLASIVIVTIFFSISGFYLVESYRRHPYSSHTETYKLAVLQAKTSYATSVKPSIIYDYATIIYNPTVYLSLANSVQYKFKLNWILYNNTKKGVVINTTHYLEPSITITTPAWSKKFPLTPKISESNSLTINDSIVLKDIENLVKTIDLEVQSASRRYDVNISIKLVVASTYSNGEKKQYVLEPYILLSVNELNNILVITTGGLTNTYSENNERITENKLYLPFGFSVSVASARSITLYTTIILGVVMMNLVFLASRVYGFTIEKNTAGLKKRVINGVVDESRFKLVVVSDIHSFNAISRKYDLPVIYNPEIGKYYLVLNDTVYVYSETSNRDANRE